MRYTKVVTIFAALLVANMISASLLHAAEQGEKPSESVNYKLQAQQYFSNEQYPKLEALFGELVASKERAEDGRYQLYMVTSGFDEWFGLLDEDVDRTLSRRLTEWRKQFPDSASEPIIEAIRMHALAWRARGGGFSNKVADEAWELFRKRNEQAWQILMDSRKTSSAIPTWYEVAISVGDDMDKPRVELRELFEEGIRRFPGYHPIYFTFTRQFSPRWGGDYEAADAFIKKVVAAKTNPEGEELYARLYWLLDQIGGSPEGFFTDSLVSWPRMRSGFEILMKKFPHSVWNTASFAMFACRARDNVTYYRLRPTVDAGLARLAGGGAYSLEVCDARFMKETENRLDKPSARFARNLR